MAEMFGPIRVVSRPRDNGWRFPPNPNNAPSLTSPSASGRAFSPYSPVQDFHGIETPLEKGELELRNRCVVLNPESQKAHRSNQLQTALQRSVIIPPDPAPPQVPGRRGASSAGD